MNFRKILPFIIAGALVAAVGSGVLLYRTVRAAVTPTTSPSVEYHGIGIGGGVTDEELASALGITVEELNTARETANDAAIDQAVEQGLITQAQADQLRERGFAFPFGRLGGFLGDSEIDYQALLADALGITVDELQAAYNEAFIARIDQAVEEGRLTQEEADLLKGRRALFGNSAFQSAMQSAFEAAVQAAVDSGVITQAQADQILSNMGGKLLPGFGGFGGFGEIERFHGGRGHGRFEFRGDFGDRLPPIPDEGETEVTPSTGL